MKEKLYHYFMGVFPGLVLFVIYPLTIYLPNQQEFEFQLDVLLPFMVVAIMWAVIIAPFVFISRMRKGKFFHALFYLGLFFLFKEIVAPLKSEGLLGLSDTLIVHESASALILEFVLLAVLAGLLFFASKKFTRQLLVPAALIFIGLQLIFTFTQLKNETGESATITNRAVLSERAGKKQQGNIYLICLDGAMAWNFPEVLKSGRMQNAFSGFTFFKNNMTNYTFTMPSIASTLGATFYKNGSIKQWIEEHRERRGLIRSVAEAGFNVWMYSGYKHVSVPAHQFSPRKKNIRYRFTIMIQLESVWLLRAVPTIFKKETARNLVERRNILKMANVNLVANSLAQLNGFVEDERKRPAKSQFVYVHVYIPHKPYVYDADCKEVLLTGNYIGQAACSLRPIVRWLDFLKREERFSESTIIIFGDHGMVGGGDGGVPSLQSKNLLKKIQKIGDKHPQNLHRWSTALLLIKPPATFISLSEPLQVSPRQTQNGDIVATLADVAGLDFSAGIGISVFNRDFPENREVDIFHGYEQAIYTKVKRGSMKTIRGKLLHFKYNYQKGWRFIQDVACVW